MSDDTLPHEVALAPKSIPSPFAKPIPPSPPVAPEAWAEVGVAAMNVAELDPKNPALVTAAATLADTILRHFPDDGGAVEEAAMHNVGRVLAHLCGVTVPVEND